jgi:hypothetical protein
MPLQFVTVGRWTKKTKSGPFRKCFQKVLKQNFVHSYFPFLSFLCCFHIHESNQPSKAAVQFPHPDSIGLPHADAWLENGIGTGCFGAVN